jgi:hypothetical protein
MVTRLPKYVQFLLSNKVGLNVHGCVMLFGQTLFSGKPFLRPPFREFLKTPALQVVAN